MKGRVVKQFKVKATPEQVQELVVEFCRKKYQTEGIVAVPITFPDGNRTFKLYKVDPAVHTFDEWQTILIPQATMPSAVDKEAK